MSRKVLNCCRTIVSFQQTHPEDLKVLAPSLGYGNIDFTELIHEVERNDGWEWQWVKEFSRSVNWGENESESTSENDSFSESTQEGQSVGARGIGRTASRVARGPTPAIPRVNLRA